MLGGDCALYIHTCVPVSLQRVREACRGVLLPSSSGSLPSASPVDACPHQKMCVAAASAIAGRAIHLAAARIPLKLEAEACLLISHESVMP